MKTASLMAFKRRAAEMISALAEDRESVLITQHGRPAAYLVDVESYEGLNEKLAVLESIACGECAIEEGRVVSHKKARKQMSRWLS